MTAASDLTRHVPALLRRARALLRLSGGPDDRLAPGELKPAARAVAALHEGLVGDRALARPSTYDARAHLGAYLLWWWPQSYAKVRAALRLLPPALGAGARVLDLGAGPVPGALAAIDHLRELHGRAGEALATDASELALEEARALSGGSVRTQRSLFGSTASDSPKKEQSIAGQFDLILAANLLSELPSATPVRASLLADLCERNLAPGGVLLVVEPALRETGRALLEVRDAVLAQHGLYALAPCLTQKPCPALVAARDWCTAARPWQAPLHVGQLARELGLHADEELSFAFAALGRLSELHAPPDAELWRVVGLRPVERGKQRVFVCSDAGRLPLSRLDREESAANAAFSTLERGDLVRLRGLGQKGDGLRAGPAAEVIRLGESAPAHSQPAAPPHDGERE